MTRTQPQGWAPPAVGIQLPESERRVPWSEYIAIARAAEAGGFDSIWVADHLLYRDDDGGERGPWEAWTLLSALAAATERVTLGPLVACAAFHPPGLLAKMASTIDEISGGRFVLGLGAGWNEVEFRAFGLPCDHRVSRFEEAWTIVRRLLDGQRVTVDGRFTTADDLLLLPKPSRRLPLMLGSVGPRMQSIALPHADAWNAWYGRFGNTAEGFAEHNAQVTRIATEVGRDPSEIRRSACILVALDGAPGDRPAGPPALALEGDPSRLATMLREFRAAGADEVIIELDRINEPAIRRLGEYLALLK